MTRGESRALLETVSSPSFPKQGRERGTEVLIPIPWELSGGLAIREEAGECVVESLRWGQLQRWLEKVPFNCHEGCRGSSPE